MVRDHCGTDPARPVAGSVVGGEGPVFHSDAVSADGLGCQPDRPFAGADSRHFGCVSALRPAREGHPFVNAPFPLDGEFDVTAGDPPVPLATWRTPRDPGSAQDAVPTALAARLCAAFSRAGEFVVDAIGEPSVSAAAAAYGRRHHRVPAAALARTLPTDQPLAALVLLRWPPNSEPDASLPVDRVLAGAAWLLRRGGCLVVVADPPAGLGSIIDAASRAGLRYLQHVIAIDADVLGDQLHNAAAAVPPARHARAHRDVLVFTRPADHEPDQL